MDSTIQLDLDGMVAQITLNDPARLNAQSVAWTQGFHDALDEIDAASGVRAVVITGAGRAFCAGGDLDHPTFRLDGIEARRPNVESGYRLFRRLRALPQATIAAVNGPAAGSGLTLAAACDLRISARSAFFAVAFVDVGVVPDQGGCIYLPQIIGTGRALHLALTGERLDPDKALAWGLVTEVVDDDALVARAHELARLIAAKPPLAVRYVSRDMIDLPHLPFDVAMTIEAEHLNYLIGTDDCREAISAFKERRAPIFGGH